MIPKPTILVVLAFVYLYGPVRADDGRKPEVALPIVRLASIPRLDIGELAPPSQERIQQIEELIEDLSDLEERDVGLLRMPAFGTVFLPVGEFSGFGERLADKESRAFPPLRQLVEIGPDAIPCLLKALDDQRPTKLVIKAEPKSPGIYTMMWFDDVLMGNPANPTERAILKLKRYPYMAGKEPEEQVEAYRVKIGDVCFAALGQIVGRSYEPVRRYHVKAPGYVICSPAHNRKLRSRIRRIWQSKKPKQKLLESLLLDYSTRGVYAGGGLDDWDVGNEFQLKAVIRLLYYFPEESSSLIACRLDELDVSNDIGHWGALEQTVKNGVRAEMFIEAVGWCEAEEIREALIRVAHRALDRTVLRAMKKVGVEVEKD